MDRKAKQSRIPTLYDIAILLKPSFPFLLFRIFPYSLWKFDSHGGFRGRWPHDMAEGKNVRILIPGSGMSCCS